MHNIDWLTGKGHLEKLRLASNRGASAEIYRYGAHLTSWRTAAGREWIFTSTQAEFSPGTAIRGGVPIIFPQFNAFGSGPRHGFARTHFWQLNQPPTAVENHNRCVFSLRSNADTQALWNNAFSADSITDLDDQQLRLRLQVTNTDDKPWSFTAALHTYFAVDDFCKARLQGLDNLTYWDNNGADFHQRQSSTSTEIHFSEAIDRVYFQVTKPLVLVDGEHRLTIANEGFADVVVWNPGAAAAKKMTDLADEEWKKMVCVEAAMIDQPIKLAPGETWTGCQILTAK